MFKLYANVKNMHLRHVKHIYFPFFTLFMWLVCMGQLQKKPWHLKILKIGSKYNFSKWKEIAKQYCFQHKSTRPNRKRIICETVLFTESISLQNCVNQSERNKTEVLNERNLGFLFKIKEHLLYGFVVYSLWNWK